MNKTGQKQYKMLYYGSYSTIPHSAWFTKQIAHFFMFWSLTYKKKTTEWKENVHHQTPLET